MSLLNNLNARLIAKKSADRTPFEKMGADITTSMVSNTTAVFKGLTEKVVKACPGSACGKVCPDCGKVHPQDQQGGNNQQGNQQNNQQGNQQNNNQQNPTQGGGNNNNLDQNPDNQAQPQITTASSMLQSMGSALKHPVQVNHDAAGVGVTHAAMLVHPEWNHDAVKSKIDSHLKAQNWKSGKGASGATGSKTYESPEGHKIHVAPVGKHLIISAEDKKGTAPTPYTAPAKPAKKSENIILDTFEIGIMKAIASINDGLLLKANKETD